MDIIRIKDKDFKTFLSEAVIMREISRVAAEMEHDLCDKNPLFVCVLNGSFMFAADLLRRLSFPCEVSFVKLSSYVGTVTSGKVNELIGLDFDIAGRSVVIVEDIVDTGNTMQYLLEQLRRKNPRDVRIATLLLKPGKLQVDLKIDYVAVKIPDDFIVGYGLDYDGYGRNLREIYVETDKC